LIKMAKDKSPIELSEDLKEYVGLLEEVKNYERDADLGGFSGSVAERYFNLKSVIENTGNRITMQKPHYKELFDVLKERLNDV